MRGRWTWVRSPAVWVCRPDRARVPRQVARLRDVGRKSELQRGGGGESGPGFGWLRASTSTRRTTDGRCRMEHLYAVRPNAGHGGNVLTLGRRHRTPSGPPSCRRVPPSR